MQKNLLLTTGTIVRELILLTKTFDLLLATLLPIFFTLVGLKKWTPSLQ